MKSRKLLYIALLLIITLINILYILNEQEKGNLSYGMGRLTILFIIITGCYIVSTLTHLMISSKIVKWMLLLGLFILVTTSLNLEAIDFISAISTMSFSIYCLMAFYFGYAFIKQNPSLFQFSFLAVVMTFPLILYTYIHQILFLNFSAYGIKIVLTKVYYLLLFLPFVYLLRGKKMQMIILCIIGGVVFISFKRTGVIAFAASVMVFYLMNIITNTIRKTNKFFVLVSFLILVVVLFNLFNYLSYETDSFLIQRFKSLEVDEGSGRLSIWKDVIELQEKAGLIPWIVGHGYSTVQKTYIANSSHNDFLEVLYDYGVITFSIYCIIYIKLYKLCKKMYNEKSPLLSSFAASCIIFFVLSNFSHLIIYPTYFVYLTLFWGIVIAEFENKREKALIKENLIMYRLKQLYKF